ncbi:general stress protein [Austwickia chelonae]|uniref:general stress protein n=1 Tax=Austwickia chelonae TaxID=100225 RepID=UPI001968A1EE|nr:general stress protein [Austwickia chelonae]
MSSLQLQHPVSLQVFEEYEQAQRAVDYLSDREFPVENMMIVGTDLKQVERVTGRLTGGRVLASGAGSGAWMGMFFGSLMWLFVEGAGPGQFLTAVLVGAVFGMIWAVIAYRFSGGARDFTSVSQVVATRYEVLVEHHLIEDARRLMEEMRQGVPGGTGTPPVSPNAPQAPGPWGSGQQPTQDADNTQHPAQHAWGAPQASPAAPTPEPEPATQPKYRTYGEALDAQRAEREAREQAGKQPPTATTLMPQKPPAPPTTALPQNADGQESSGAAAPEGKTDKKDA